MRSLTGVTASSFLALLDRAAIFTPLVTNSNLFPQSLMCITVVECIKNLVKLILCYEHGLKIISTDS
jgi:hypothetical protein